MASTSSNSVPAITTDAPTSSTATTTANVAQDYTDDMAPLPPPSRPYAEPTAASTRTSLTHVDGDGDEDREDRNVGEGTTSHATTGAGEASTHEGPALETTEGEVGDKSKPESSSSSQPVPASSQPPTETVQAQVPSATLTQPTQPPVPQTPQTYLTFLLISGKRRTMSFEPETTIGRVKELVWNGWPTEWQDEHPPAPSYLRVLYLGKMLQDDETLTKLKLPTYTPSASPSEATSTPPPHGPIPTIVHLSIRPYAPPGEGDTLKKKKGKRAASSTDVSPSTSDETHTGGGCCGCVIC